MAVTTTAVDVGSAPNDGTGDPARTGGQVINTNISNLDTAVEALQSGGWELDNTSSTMALGERHICTSHAGITKTLPAASALATDSLNDIWILNNDTNSNVTIDPNGTDAIFVNGTSAGAGTNVTLQNGYCAILVRKSGGWDLIRWAIDELTAAVTTLAGLTDVTVTSVASGEVLAHNGSNWVNRTLEENNIVDRAAPAHESTPYIYHEDLGTQGAGTKTIDITTQPSANLTVTATGVTIHFDTPALTLPERGLNDVCLVGRVFVKASTNITAPSVTTDAGTSVIKGTGPTTTNEWATLVWQYFDNGTTDLLWAEWVPDA